MATGVTESTGRFQKGIWRCYWKVNSLCFISRELEGLLIEYLDPKLIWWHDLTPQYNHISKTQDISNWKRGIFSLIWKMLWGFQLNIRSTKVCLTTLNNRHTTPNFTACWWILLSFFPSYQNSYFVALWRYAKKTKHKNPNYSKTIAMRHEQLQQQQQSHRNRSNCKVRRVKRLGTKFLDCFIHYKKQGYDWL